MKLLESNAGQLLPQPHQPQMFSCVSTKLPVAPWRMADFPEQLSSSGFIPRKETKPCGQRLGLAISCGCGYDIDVHSSYVSLLEGIAFRDILCKENKCH